MLRHMFGQSANVKIDVNKILQKYQIDCLLKQKWSNQVFAWGLKFVLLFVWETQKMLPKPWRQKMF